ncbi:MAG: hypothetical protein IKL55_03745 [Clostridia bacterium]|nr:hypothetical protein [Clostridia bacterium]
MENVAKALMISAGVLLGIMLLSVMIYVFRQGAKVNQAYDNKQVSLQLELYNSQFEHYDRNNNNIMDVISLCNLAFDVNIDSNYEPQNAVEIEVEVGNKTFKIPNAYCIVCKDNTKADLKNKKCLMCGKDIFVKRNHIIDESNNQISIYNLAKYTLSELGITTGITADFSKDTLSTTKLKDGKTIYKFLLEVQNSDDFQYHSENMKVSKIKLIAYDNPEW